MSTHQVIATPMGRCRMGTAAVDITPPPDSYHRNWGAALHDAAEGIHRPLQATALVLQNISGKDEHSLIRMDLGWMSGPEMDALLHEVARGTGMEADRVVITLAHTHAAINLDLSRQDEPGGNRIRPYLEALPGRLVQAMLQARKNARLCEAAFATGHCGLAWQRDYWDEQRKIFACGTNPDAAADDTVLVMRFTDMEGRPAAYVANYACHPTTLAWRNRLISPDYVGALREVVEEHTGVPCIFLQGAAGDLGPREGFVGNPAVADRNGRQVGYAVLETIQNLPPVGTQMEYAGPVISGATLAMWEHVPVPAERLRRMETFRGKCLRVQLPLREMPSLQELENRLAGWLAREKQARADGDEKQTRNCRAQVERVRRWMRRRESRAGRGEISYPVRLWQIGEGVMVLLGGEPYSWLQRALRGRFPGTPIVVTELCNQGFSYILPREQYGKGLYQDECAILGAGSLEAIADAVAGQLAQWGLE